MAEQLQLPGEWALDETGKRYSGVLFVDQDAKSIVLKVWFYGEDQKTVEPFKVDFVRAYVVGRLLNGKRMTLVSCEGRLCKISANIKSPRYTSEYQLLAKYAFVNVDVKCAEELKFFGTTVDFGDIGEWARISSVSYRMDEKKSNSYYWQMQCGTGTQIWLRQHDSVFFSTGMKGGRTKDMHAKVVLEQPTRVQFCYPQRVQWDRVMEDVQIVRELIAFGLDRHVGVENVQTLHDSMLPDQFKGCRSIPGNFSESVYIGDRYVAVPQRKSSTNVYLTLDDLIPILNPVSAGLNRLGFVRPVVRLFLDAHIYTDEFHADKVFMYLVRGLEIAHLQMDLMDGGKGDQVTLSTRLHSLMDPLCGVEGAGCEQDSIDGEIEKIVATRNYYTHFTEKWRVKAIRDERLFDVNQKLTQMLRYYILKLIGLPEKVAQKRVGYGTGHDSECISESWSVEF